MSLTPRVVLFDLDGTIMDSRPGIVAGLTRGLESVGLTVAADYDWTPYLGPPLRDSFASEHSLSPGDIDTAVAAYLDYYESEGKYVNAVYPGMADLLAALGADGRTVALATSKRAFLADDIVTHFGLRDHFAHVGGSRPDGTGGRKDEVIEATLTALGVRPGGDVVMVGDRRHDIEGAQRVGVTTIGVRWGYAVDGELEAARADVVVDTVEDLATRLR